MAFTIPTPSPEQKAKQEEIENTVPTMIPCDSSNVSGFNYWKAKGILIVEYTDGAVYHFKCPEGVFYAMMIAKSKGRFLWQSVRNVYPYERVG